ncbi:molybdenum cofactor guanylyltransferase [Taibaiella chishuiensis]|uniref:Molybdopterin-guanine dinucleotide biosynthesis protein A n=1 Tax=Taibaiella chishuiensis TaxID=1434707 RepID=A0A2P8CV32_9BACT|nr:molybdenum cofactor guanylyltransferase [Taibaiella chishuiensis]PSK88812.1 molybdopterin-guanine dinucleotide biosynthesis protein A [Taibaiella chishuiensis]
MQEKNKITGIVVCGGQSSRMGTGKYLLDYHGRPQALYLYDMLQGLCSEVWLSVNAEQVARLPAGFPLLPDLPAYEQAGPMAALLTAADLLPGHNFLFVGCDYPFLRRSELERFLLYLSPGRPAAFYNEAAGVYEPLLAYYPATCAQAAGLGFAQGRASLQALLRAEKADPYLPADLNCLSGADTPEQYEAAKAITSRPEFKKEG